MSRIIIEKTLSAAFSNPVLLNEIPFSACKENHVVSIFQILAAHKIAPPNYYYSLTYSILGRANSTSYHDIFATVDTSSLTSMVKTLVSNYYQTKQTNPNKFDFTREQIVELIKSLAILIKNEVYYDTALDLLHYFTDILLRNHEFVTPDQSIEILRLISGVNSSDISIRYLKDMCKAHIIENIDIVSGDFNFYKDDDFLYYLLKSKGLIN